MIDIVDANGATVSPVSQPYNPGVINPIRYRGYYYDGETGFYYIGSRYYDPVTMRFMNADDTDTLIARPMALIGKNLYAYCYNNPVMLEDEDGELPTILIGAGIGLLISGAAKVITNKIDGKPLTDGLGTALLVGAASGALAATGFGIGWQIAGNAFLSSTGSVTNHAIEKKGIKNLDWGDWGSIAKDGLIGGITGFIGGKGANGKVLAATYKSAQKKITRELRRKNVEYATKPITRCTAEKVAVKKLVTVSVVKYTVGTTFSSASPYINWQSYLRYLLRR